MLWRSVIAGHKPGVYCLEGHYGTGVRSGSTSRPRYVLHVGHI